jgi:hypothetical protein
MTMTNFIISKNATKQLSWVVDANNESAAIQELADMLFEGDISGLSVKVAPKSWMIYKDGKICSASEGHTAEDAITAFIDRSRVSVRGGHDWAAKEITEDASYDDGWG